MEEWNWNEPFLSMLSVSQESDRVEEEGGVRLGESIISSRLLDNILFVLLLVLLFGCLLTLHYGTQVVPVFDDVQVYKRLAYWLMTMLMVSTVLGRISIRRVSAVRAVSALTILYILFLLLHHQNLKIDRLSLLLCHFAALVSITFAPLFTHNLQSRYLKSSFAHKQTLYRQHTAMVSDLLGRNVRKTGIEELGEICKSAFMRLSGGKQHLVFDDFLAPFNGNSAKATRAFLHFAPNTSATINDRKFAYTISEIINEWRLIHHSIDRSTNIFSVFCGLLDFLSVMLSALFAMAVLGFSALDMIGAALFMYGIVNGFFGEAVQQWKLGTYLIIAVHPYDIGDSVRIPLCGTLTVVDYSLTRTLFRKDQGQSVTMQHRHMAYLPITNLSRPKSHRVVLTLLAGDVDQGTTPVASFIHQICAQDPHFKNRFQISTRGGGFGMERRMRIQLTFEEGLNARQRMRGLVSFCSTLKAAAVEAQVDEAEDN